MRGDLAGVTLMLGEQLEDAPPSRIRECLERLHERYVTTLLRNCQVTKAFISLSSGRGNHRCVFRPRGDKTTYKRLVAVGVAGLIGAIVAWAPWASSSPASRYEPALDPASFSTVIDNEYFPLPVGRTLVYRGMKDGQTLEDRVTVTSRTKVVAEGITARVVTDVATHEGALREKTSDWYAQDKQGNVWYVGEDTAAYLPNGKVDRSGSWEAGVRDAEPGIIMEADPQIPDAFRQEFLRGEAEDTAWIVDRGRTTTVPAGTFKNTLASLEATRIEPGAYDEKIYAPGIGIVSERALTGASEYAQLVSVRG